MRLRRWLPLAAGLALVAVGGCSRDNTGSFATVSGKVTLNGAAADGVKVTLHSTVEAGGKKAGPFSAMTDSSGHYMIATVGKDPGIPPGMYKVTVTKLDMKGNVPPDFDQGQLEASGQALNLMPKDYESLGTTKLSVTLEPGKNENKNFELKGKPANSKAGATP